MFLHSQLTRAAMIFGTAAALAVSGSLAAQTAPSGLAKDYPILSKFNSGRAPSNRILRRGDRDVYAILHYGTNTFGDKEWGFGDADPQSFAPTQFDAEQIAKACRDGGITGVIIVCKHHDGLCLWPTKTTEYNITKTKFRDGKGDYVKEMSDACRKYGLDVGFYVSPWDRNNADYSTPAYLLTFQEQLREVLSNYGPAFEVFLDGANGGDGYYGGAKERRNIDHRVYYDWVNTWQIIRDLQPNAAIFSDIGPDVRWIGNEHGFADEESFGSFTPHNPFGKTGTIEEPMPGYCNTNEAMAGHKDGKFFLPGDCDVALQPGWFYHDWAANAQKSVRHLIQIYLRSVGCGAYMNLGLAPDRRGILHENDVKRLKEFKAAVDSLFEHKVFGDEISLENNVGTILFGEKRKINFVKIAENLAATQGECVSGYEISVRQNGAWKKVLSGKAIGLKRLKAFPTQECDGIRIHVTESSAPVYGLRFSGYLAPSDLIGETVPELQNDLRKRPNYIKLAVFDAGGSKLEFNLSGKKKLESLVFTPVASVPAGTPDRCIVEVYHNKKWDKVIEYEFSNIKANPIPQPIPLKGIEAERIRFTASHMLEQSPDLAFSEIGILTE